MSFDLIIFNSSIIQKQATYEIEKCNDFTANYGLVLTDQQAVELVQTRTNALNLNGRIEFGGGIINKIIKEFCDSPNISMYNYTKTLHELIEVFYYYKNDTLDLISDDDLLKFMKESFDGVCQGSLELLSGRELTKLAHNLRYSYAPNHSEDNTLDYYEGDDYDEY